LKWLWYQKVPWERVKFQVLEDSDKKSYCLGFRSDSVLEALFRYDRALSYKGDTIHEVFVLLNKPMPMLRRLRVQDPESVQGERNLTIDVPKYMD
jgi:hypothetical protein